MEDISVLWEIRGKNWIRYAGISLTLLLRDGTSREKVSQAEPQLLSVALTFSVNYFLRTGECGH